MPDARVAEHNIITENNFRWAIDSNNLMTTWVKDNTAQPGMASEVYKVIQNKF